MSFMLFWLTFLGLCCFGAASILRSVLSLYSNDVVSYSVETDYLSWETPFPAITVCEDKVNLNRMKGWLASENMPASLSSFFKEVFYWSEKFCKCDYKPDDLNKKYIEDYQKYTYKVRYNCSQMITDCSWNGLPFECCDRFLPLETEIGICFSFNSQLTKPESTIVTLNRKARQLPELVFTTPAPQYTSLKIHGPDEAISAPTMNDVLGRKNSLLKPDGLNPPIDIDISLKVEEHTVSDISVSTLPPSLRGCLYKHEKPDFARLWPFKVYSLNTCVLYCRLIWQVNQCNCTHHFMPQLEGVPVCGISGMRCLFSYKDDFLSVGVECECPLACEDTIYKLVNMFKEDHSEEVEKGATRVRISFSSLLSLRIRRQAIRGMLTFVVDIGGLGGVFFGASLLSVIEIVYLLFIRSGP
ncbi:hypothetical protein O0L34_g17372 [Tuta absoluta]|nr:hypothetical protein O0L34_g17372 [Tuta absoluta]